MATPNKNEYADIILKGVTNYLNAFDPNQTHYNRPPESTLFGFHGTRGIRRAKGIEKMCLQAKQSASYTIADLYHNINDILPPPGDDYSLRAQIDKAVKEANNSGGTAYPDFIRSNLQQASTIPSDPVTTGARVALDVGVTAAAGIAGHCNVM